MKLELKFSDIPKCDGLYGLAQIQMSDRLRTLSLDPVKTRCSLLGANAIVLTSAVCPSTCELGLLEFSLRVSQLEWIDQEWTFGWLENPHHELLVVAD